MHRDILYVIVNLLPISMENTVAKTETKAKSDKTEEKNAVVPTPTKSTLPAVADDNLFAEDAGRGTEDATMRDQIIPFFKIIQKQSAQMKKSDLSNYLEDAEEGDFFNMATKELFSGSTGVYAIPVEFARRYTEWKPRGQGGQGGLVADYGDDESCISKRKAVPNKKGVPTTPDGNVIVLSGNHFCILVDVEEGRIIGRCVMSMASTSLKKSREWITQIKNLRLRNSEGKEFNPASFYMVYHLTTVIQSNADGEWYNFNISPFKPVVEIPNGREIYLQCREFYSEIRAGKVQMDSAENENSGSGNEDLPF